MRTHTNEGKVHSCSQCSKTFFGKSELAAHMRVHTGDKPYVCEICNRAFTQKGNLKTHQKTHMSLSFLSTAAAAAESVLPLSSSSSSSTSTRPPPPPPPPSTSASSSQSTPTSVSLSASVTSTPVSAPIGVPVVHIQSRAQPPPPPLLLSPEQVKTRVRQPPLDIVPSSAVASFRPPVPTPVVSTVSSTGITQASASTQNNILSPPSQAAAQRMGSVMMNALPTSQPQQRQQQRQQELQQELQQEQAQQMQVGHQVSLLSLACAQILQHAYTHIIDVFIARVGLGIPVPLLLHSAQSRYVSSYPFVRASPLSFAFTRAFLTVCLHSCISFLCRHMHSWLIAKPLCTLKSIYIHSFPERL